MISGDPDIQCTWEGGEGHSYGQIFLEVADYGSGSWAEESGAASGDLSGFQVTVGARRWDYTSSAIW